MPNNYTIDYQGLSVAEHHFCMPFGDDLFHQWSESPIQHGNGTVSIDMVRSQNMMELQVSITGDVMVECDRCTDQYMQHVEFNAPLVVKINPDADNLHHMEDGEIIWLSPKDPRLDLKEWIYESVVLSLPMQRVHPNIKNCNQEILKYINIPK